MIEVKKFTFNPFQENTYLLINGKKDCLIIDAGCYFPNEKKLLLDTLKTEGLNPVRLLNTHCHLDHIFGNKLIFQEFGLRPEIHELEHPMLDLSPKAAQMYNVPFEPSPEPKKDYLKENEPILWGEDRLELILAPGHSPGSLCFYSEKQKFLIGGDVLFRESIGRSDLPGGDHETLIRSIQEKLYVLPDEVIVYSGHGPETTIGHEKKNNPFVRLS